jgi:hypothetical protein
MDNVLNRPLFRHREARDRLNDIAGVQRFEVGGPVQGFQPGGEVRPEGLPSIMEILQAGSLGRNMPMAAGQVTNLPEVERPLTEREKEAAETGSSMRSYIDRGAGAISSLGMGGYGALTDALSPAFATLGATSLAAELERQSDIAYNIALSNLTKGFSATEGMSPSDFDLEPADFDFAIARAKADAKEGKITPTGPRTETATPGDRQAPMAYASPAELAALKPTAPRTGPTTPGDRQRPMAYTSPAEAAAAAEAAKAPSTMEADARGRGPLITNPADVAAGLNAEDPAVREKTVADFMREYTANAPKYEGADKNLMLAQIGFAIAAGESPNAMQNIANGLLAGSQAISQDKAAKAEFDRQLQLNALQYGLEGAESEREKGKPSLQFVATKDMTWKGRPVKEGSPVYLSYKDIADAGGVVPDGLVDAATSAALIEKTQGVRKAYQDAYDRGVIDDTELRLATEGYADQASRVAKSQRALDYFEKTLFKLGEEGNLTGIEGSFQKLIGKLGNAAGFTANDLDVLAKSGDAAEMEELLYRGVINTVPAVVEGQSANSISDTDVRLAMKGLVDLAISQGTFSSLFTSEEKVMRQIQDSMNLIAGNRQRAFAEMSAIEARLANRYTKAGDYYNPAYATDVLRPLREASGLTEQPDMVSTYGDMVLGENGTYKLILPGG